MKNIRLAALFLAATVCLAPRARTAGIPEPIIPEGVGVNIHFTTGHEKDLDLIAAAGFRFVRMDFFWTDTEPRKGEYNWSAYDGLLAQLDKRGIRAYFIFDYSHPLYEPAVVSTNPLTGKLETDVSGSPQHPESIAAFAQWAAAAAKHFQGRGVIWEIWNEPNGDFWKPKPNVEQYIALAQATCRAVREADPGATIVAPATSGFAWDFMEKFAQSGLLAQLDAVSVHPYRAPHQVPESAAGEYQRLRALIEKYAPEGKKQMPIVSGEWGYSSNTKGVTRERQAEFAARQQLFNLASGIPLSIWYDWKNDGPDPAENEHNFGTVNTDLTPKPAYTAISTLTRELNGFRFCARFDVRDADKFVLAFTNATRETKLAAWTIGTNNTVTLPLSTAAGEEVSFVNGTNQPGSLTVEKHQIIVPLNNLPKYLDLKKGNVAWW